MIRFLGILLIFTASSSAGMFLSGNIKNKRERLLKERKMLEEISIMIRFNSLTLKEIIYELINTEIYNTFKFLKILDKRLNESVPFQEMWEQSVRNDDTLSADEIKLLSELGCSLGTTDAEGQLSTLNIYKTRLDEMIEAETEKYRVKGKMYRSLGVMFGAMIGILIV